MADTDRSLLNQWFVKRDTTAFQAIVERYSAMVFATARRVIGSVSEVDDVTYESFAALATLTGGVPAYIGPWLHRTAATLALKRVRTDAGRARRERSYQNLSASQTNAMWDEIQQNIDEVIAGLPDKMNEAVVGHFLQGRTQGDLAQELNVSRETIATRVEKGVEEIRKAFVKRGLPVNPQGLSAFMTAHLADAVPVPAVLMSRLSDIAPANVQSISPGATIIEGISGSRSSMPAIVGVAVAILIAAIGAFWLLRGDQAPSEPAPPGALSDAAQPDPGNRARDRARDSESPSSAQQGTRSGPSASQSRSGRVEIRLVTADGNRVRDIRESVLTSNGNAMPTPAVDATGPNQFAIANLPFGEYALEVRTAEYEPATIPKITLSANSPRASVSVNLTPRQPGPLTVRVVDPSGQPVPNADITLFRTDSAGTRRGAGDGGTLVQSGRTDSNGEWIVEGLQAGAYRAECQHVLGAGNGIAELPKLNSIRINLEHTTGIDYQLIITDTVTGTELPEAGGSQFVIQADGAISEDLVPGNNKLILVKRGYTAAIQDVAIPETAPGAVFEIPVQLGEAGIIVGTAVDANNQPVSGRQLLVFPSDLWSVAQSEWSAEWRRIGAALAQGARTDAEGNFAIDHLPAGDFVVALSESAYSAPVRVTANYESPPVFVTDQEVIPAGEQEGLPVTEQEELPVSEVEAP